MFLAQAGFGLSGAVLTTLLAEKAPGASAAVGVAGFPQFAPKAKRVIYLFQSGGPSQMDLFDYKPKLSERRGADLPDSIRMGQRLTTMTAGQDRLPVAPSLYLFAQHGECGAWMSELLPHTARIVDDLCIVKSMHTEAINHDPAVTFFQTGSQIAGRPSMGAWLAYGLGNEADDLPAFVVMVSQEGKGGQPLYDRLWGSGFLPSKYQGVKLRSVGDPVLFLSNPPGIDGNTRRRVLDDLAHLNEMEFAASGDPEIDARIAQYEMAFRMQASVPELTDLSDEPEHIFESYGADSRQRGTFAHNCLLAPTRREGRSFRAAFSARLGPPRLVAQEAGTALQNDRPSLRRIDLRPEAARPVGRYTGDLGRRVRAHRLLSGQADRHRLWPRPPPAVLHHVDGRRGFQAGRHLRRNRRLLLQHRS